MPESKAKKPVAENSEKPAEKTTQQSRQYPEKGGHWTADKSGKLSKQEN